MKKVFSLLAAIIVPFLIFTVVILLNDTVTTKKDDGEKKSNFRVEKKKQIKQEKPKPKLKPKKRRSSEPTPSITPTNVGNNVGGSGLSFGVPAFSEAQFEDFKDDSLLGDVSNKALDKSSVDTVPKAIKRAPIVYPELARKQGISGYVLMNVLINESGNVEDVKILESKPQEIFDLKAESSMRRWKFEPATYMGRKVKVWATQKITFKLD